MSRINYNESSSMYAREAKVAEAVYLFHLSKQQVNDRVLKD